MLGLARVPAIYAVVAGGVFLVAWAFRAALKLDPLNHPDYALDLAAVQLESGDVKGAVATAQAMLRLYPVEVVANRSADGTVAPNLANLEALVGDVFLERGDLRGAGSAARRALILDSGNVRARALQHQVILRSGVK